MTNNPQQSTCPNCGAELRDGKVCWLCRSPVDHAQGSPGKVSASKTRVPPIQFGLDSMLLLMTFVAVVCGVFVVAPGAGVVVAVLALPALVRTALLARRDRVAGEPMAWGVKTLTFLATMSFVVVLVASMAAAFYATCWVGFWAGMFGHSAVDQSAGYAPIGTGLVVGIILGVIAAALVMWWLIRRVVKTNYRVPAWTGWFGFLVALGSFAAFWPFHSDDAEILSFLLSMCGIGLVFSFLGLGTPRRWNNAWGVGLGTGPVATWMVIALINHDWSLLDSIAAPIMATIITLVIAAPLHWWVMGMEVERRIDKPG